jgi:hypothetical protein
MRARSFGALLLCPAGLGLSGCVYAEPVVVPPPAYVAPPPVVVRPSPPPVIVQPPPVVIRPPPPGRGVWVPGHYDWRGRWVPGHWRWR